MFVCTPDELTEAVVLEWDKQGGGKEKTLVMSTLPLGGQTDGQASILCLSCVELSQPELIIIKSICIKIPIKIGKSHLLAANPCTELEGRDGGQ